MKIDLQKIEKKTYEILGVRLFRILVFKLEKAIHHRDRGKNINYHISNYEPGSLDAFIKYLFYNGAIHVRNILYFAIYIVLRIVWGRGVAWFDIVLLLFAIKDAYCIMLQRYNYIRINERRSRLEQKRRIRRQQKADQLKNSFSNNYDSSYVSEDLEVIRAMKLRISKGGSIVISESERKTLQRIVNALHNETQEKEEN